MLKPLRDEVKISKYPVACREPLGLEPFGRESLDLELETERLRVERLATGIEMLAFRHRSDNIALDKIV